jgi:predicted lipoprotein with Yx(FWY)xxD motif
MTRTTTRAAMRTWLVAAVLLLAVLLLAACGGNDAGTSETNNALDANATLTPTAAVMAGGETPAPTGGVEAPAAATAEADDAATEGGDAQASTAGGDTEGSEGTDQGLTITTVDSADVGAHLADSAGRPIYVFAGDEADASNCTGACAEQWPPVLIGQGLEPTPGEGVEGDLGRIDRGDGVFQVTYNGQPLYYYGGDQEAGQITGVGVDQQWSLATP